MAARPWLKGSREPEKMKLDSICGLRAANGRPYGVFSA